MLQAGRSWFQFPPGSLRFLIDLGMLHFQNYYIDVTSSKLLYGCYIFRTTIGMLHLQNYYKGVTS